MQLCAEGFPTRAAETVPFVMAWERKNGEAGLGVSVCESLTSHGQAGCSGSRVHTKAHGERGLSPRLEAGQPAAGCRALNRTARDGEWGGARGRSALPGPLGMLSWCHGAGRLGCVPPNPRPAVESVPDVPESHRLSRSSLNLQGSGSSFDSGRP